MNNDAPYREMRAGRPGLKLWIHGASNRCAAAHRMPAFWYVSVGIRRIFGADGAIVSVDAMAMGPTLTPYDFRPTPRTELIGLAIQPEFVPALFGARADEIAPEHVWRDPDSLLDSALRLAETGADAARVAAALGQASLARVEDRPTPPARLRAALGLVRRSAGRVRVRALADRLEMSERQLRRSMIDATGLAPKPYSRLVRYIAVLRDADRTVRPDWAGLAAAYGYSDQAHLVREAHALAGAAPARLHAERRAEADFFNQSA